MLRVSGSRLICEKRVSLWETSESVEVSVSRLSRLDGRGVTRDEVED